ncbi:hypothetical protein MLD38_010179 [Melastoma candidum]|uniref:Uncharacterized protein n=1 Tax=Melastoma candidum TaxID=119954 RepID=A0ACB9R098_9MYRT|nr:hypothetical protein MLD38_010179 [Melastoma candidum]
MKMNRIVCVVAILHVVSSPELVMTGLAASDYASALTKSLLYFEAQSTIEFRAKLKAKGELGNTSDAILWGTDYFIKAHPEPDVLYGQLFDFAHSHQGTYQSSISSAGGFYASSGFQDELVWAAAWIYHATDDKSYHDLLQSLGNSGGVKTTLCGMTKGKVASGVLYSYKSDAEQFICNCIQKGNNNVRKTPSGLLWFQEWNNLQYTGTVAFIAAVYAQYLTSKNASIQCP